MGVCSSNVITTPTYLRRHIIPAYFPPGNTPAESHVEEGDPHSGPDLPVEGVQQVAQEAIEECKDVTG